jgi:hypothetical protein
MASKFELGDKSEELTDDFDFFFSHRKRFFIDLLGRILGLIVIYSLGKEL